MTFVWRNNKRNWRISFEEAEDDVKEAKDNEDDGDVEEVENDGNVEEEVSPEFPGSAVYCGMWRCCSCRESGGSGSNRDQEERCT